MIKEERVGALYVKWVSRNVHKVEKSHFMFKRWHDRKIQRQRNYFLLDIYRFFTNHSTPAVRTINNVTLLRIVLAFSRSYIF